VGGLREVEKGRGLPRWGRFVFGANIFDGNFPRLRHHASFGCFGLVMTMVFTLYPSNILLILRAANARTSTALVV